ncbi:hypothetical protein M378DRAFT_154792, partial [Amanita muscaria Koide BX008]
MSSGGPTLTNVSSRRVGFFLTFLSLRHGGPQTPHPQHVTPCCPAAVSLRSFPALKRKDLTGLYLNRSSAANPAAPAKKPNLTYYVRT